MSTRRPGQSRDNAGHVLQDHNGASGTTLLYKGVPCPGPSPASTPTAGALSTQTEAGQSTKADEPVSGDLKSQHHVSKADALSVYGPDSDKEPAVCKSTCDGLPASPSEQVQPSGDVGPATVRTVRNGLSARNAADAFGPVQPGCSIFSLGDGSFGPVDVLTHCLDVTGPAAVTVATWTAGRRDIFRTAALLRDGRITSLRMVTDKSLPQRQPAYFHGLIERYGPTAVCLSSVHAKFWTLRNAAWNLVLLTSSNLDGIRRLECFELTDDAGLAAHLDSVVDRLFASPGASFEAVVADYRPARRFFGDGPLAADVRRAGWSYRATGTALR